VPAWVTFLSDYGLDDAFVGVCHGVMARICPDVRIIDVCHQIAPQDIAQGATVFANAVGHLPAAVHLLLVDPPQVTNRRGVLVRATDGSLLLGPDNGVLSLGWEALGGVAAAWELADQSLWLERPSHTFRGRDVYAPVAAHLAAGVDPARVGPAIQLDSLVRLRTYSAVVDDDHVHAEVRNVDHFGNLSLNITRADLEAAGIALGDVVELRCSGRTLNLPFSFSYGDVGAGRLALCEDSFRAVMIAVNLGSAARMLRIGRGEPVVVARLPQRVAGSRPSSFADR
jgi:S-adenosylmethionine hydrolase